MLGQDNNYKVEHVVSAGGVIFRNTLDSFEIVICRRKDKWMLPKGTPETGESLEETALREVKEETGLSTNILCPLKKIHYNFLSGKKHFEKDVYFYLMNPTGGDFTEHDNEFDSIHWINLAQMKDYMTYETDIDVIKIAEQAIAQIVGADLPRDVSVGGHSDFE